MRVVVYNNWYNEKHTATLRAFHRGVPNSEFIDLRQPVDCDIAVIFGMVKRAYRPTWKKTPIIEKHEDRRLIVIESAFVKRKEYFAIGYGGIHGNADFRTADLGIKLDRWNAMGVNVAEWQDRPDGPVIVCGQLPRDTNVQDTDHVKWCQETLQWYLDRNIKVKFRPHPREPDPASVYGIDPALMDIGKIKFTLRTARAFVIWNSTSGVDATIAGVPVISQGYDALVYPYTSHDLDLSSLIKFDRRLLFTKIGYAQWSPKEMREGLPWRHLTRL